MNRYHCTFCGYYTPNTIQAETGETSYEVVKIATCDNCSEVNARWVEEEDLQAEIAELNAALDEGAIYEKV